jgi:hypothetical protein
MCEFKQAFCAPKVEPISLSQVLGHVDDARKFETRQATIGEPFPSSSAASTGTACKRRKVPLAGCFLISKDIRLIVVGINLDPTLRRSKPAIDDGTHDQSPGAKPEGDRLLFAAIACVALHA